MSAAFIALSLGNMVYVSAGFVTGALRFRLTTMLASVILVVWGAIEDNLGVIGWNSAFVIINSFQTARIARQERVTLDPADEQIRTTFFPTLNARDFLTLWTAGRGDIVDAESSLCVEGEPQEDVLLVLEGSVRVAHSRGLAVERSAPCFIGEMSFLTRAPASADVTTRDEAKIRRWNQDDLRNLHALNERCAQAWQVALGVDVANKLRSG